MWSDGSQHLWTRISIFIALTKTPAADGVCRIGSVLKSPSVCSGHSAGGDELPKAHYWCRDKDICAARRIYKNQTKRGSAEGRSEATIRPSVRSVRALGASSHNSPPHGSWPLYIARASRAATHSSEPWRWLPEAAGTCRKAAPSAPSGRPAKLCLLRRDQGGVVQSWVARAERRAQEAVDRIGGVRQHAAGAADPHPRRRL